MSDIERLRVWMVSNGLTMKSLAREMDLPYITVYHCMVRRAKLSDNFKWRFAERYGWNIALDILSDTTVVTHAPQN